MPAHNPGIDGLYAAWADAFRRGDVDAVLDLLTPDYVLWAPGAAPVGREALRPALERAFAAYEVEPRFEREDLLEDHGLALDCGWDVQHVRPRAGGDPQVRRQRVFVALRLGADGRWRFARGMSQPGPS